MKQKILPLVTVIFAAFFITSHIFAPNAPRSPLKNVTGWMFHSRKTLEEQIRNPGNYEIESRQGVDPVTGLLWIEYRKVETGQGQ